MKLFITGASGHVGSAVSSELLGAGHEVVGLARSDVSAAWDGVIHLAYKNEEMHAGDVEGANDADLRAIEVLGEAFVGTGKPFVGTSGTGHGSTRRPQGRGCMRSATRACGSRRSPGASAAA